MSGSWSYGNKLFNDQHSFCESFRLMPNISNMALMICKFKILLRLNHLFLFVSKSNEAQKIKSFSLKNWICRTPCILLPDKVNGWCTIIFPLFFSCASVNAFPSKYCITLFKMTNRSSVTTIEPRCLHGISHFARQFCCFTRQS